ncbi:MAG: type II toxin-antitoxin system VapC family toxin [Beijerinckiaceae bacterium]
MKALFDSCILIDYLRGLSQAREELDRHADRAISRITWIELLVGAPPETEEAIRRFLAGFEVIPLDDAVSEESIRLRRSHRLRLPDAIILASARVSGRLLVTRDEKAFPADAPGVRLPYKL